MTAVVSRNAMAALEEARRAWQRSQPQYVIPGVLDEPAPTPPAASPGAGSSSAPALTASGTEPRHAARADGIQSPVSEHPYLLPGVVVGAAFSTTTEAGANHCPVTRARLQSGE